jgi:Protein of unknown function (DUF2892)
MLRNESNLDRAARVVVGFLLLSLVFIGPQTPWGWLGLVLIGTAALGHCPIYRVLGVSTCRAPRSS